MIAVGFGAHILAAPITELLDAFGSTVPLEADPSETMRIGAQWAEEVHAAGRAAVAELAWSWSGPAATEAVASVERLLGDVLAGADRGLAIATIVFEGTVTVLSGAAEIARLVESFTAFAEQAAPVAAHPAGQLAMLTVGLEHLVAGIDVLTRVITTLTDLTERLTAFLPPDPAGIDPAGIDPAGIDSGVSGAPSESTGEMRTMGDFAGRGVDVVLPDGSVSRAPNETAATAVRHALAQQGTPYVWGGTSPGSGLDCSGLTQYAYAQAGLELPRLAQEQDVGSRVDPGSALPGDLVVWDGHVAMVVGNGMMVEAGDPVSVTPLRTSNSGMAFHGVFRPTVQ